MFIESRSLDVKITAAADNENRTGENTQIFHSFYIGLLSGERERTTSTGSLSLK